MKPVIISDYFLNSTFNESSTPTQKSMKLQTEDHKHTYRQKGGQANCPEAHPPRKWVPEDLAMKPEAISSFLPHNSSHFFTSAI